MQRARRSTCRSPRPSPFPTSSIQGLVEPLDGLPGAADYTKDFTPFTKQVAMLNGKLMGLPYFSAAWVWNYYTDMLEKAEDRQAVHDL